MSLVWKFFISYLVVLVVGLGVLSVSTAYVAPDNFSRSMDMMMMDGMSDGETQGNAWMGHDMQNGMMMNDGGWTDSSAFTNDQLNASFRQAVNNALWKAGLAAILAALVVSGFVSFSIIRPIRRAARASQYIAEGHYDQRLTPSANDEMGELARSFNSMAQSLADTEMMRRQLIGDVSHELKTPLASIKGYMEGLQDGVIAPTQDTFQLVHREADRLQRLVHDLQELSRAEVVSSQLALRPCDPGDLIQAVTARLLPQFVDKGIELACDIPAHVPQVRVDADRVEQVLTNLVGNALQYSPAGGQVILKAARVDGVIQFAVQDTGVGLAPEDLTKIFQRFYRVDKSRSRASGGSGVGLTIAHHIVEAHGGRIWVESPGLNQGSTFYFTLPLA
ncbi:MAG TPA: HAMP domain-containing sensor histidine kinase [Bellilinea sp.]|nr:HAMP domain-containing sensor histidine kinase [Bellilinea sp.]